MKRIFIIFLLLSAVQFLLPAQEKDHFDDALDRYEKICTRCLELRAALDRGETVSREELNGLLEQISSLKETLSDASGEMTSQQQSRYLAIRNRFLHYGENTIALPELWDQAGLVEWLGEREIPASHPSGKTRSSVTFFALVTTGISLHPVFGVSGGVSFDRIGGYLNFSMRQQLALYDYTCDSNGNTSYGKIWASGKKYYTGMRITIGGSYEFAPGWLGYAGAGYGESQVLWEDIDGNRAMVTDLSSRGLAVDAGVIYFHGHLALMAGLSALKSVYPVLGVGYRF